MTRSFTVAAVLATLTLTAAAFAGPTGTAETRGERHARVAAPERVYALTGQDLTARDTRWEGDVIRLAPRPNQRGAAFVRVVR